MGLDRRGWHEPRITASPRHRTDESDRAASPADDRWLTPGVWSVRVASLASDAGQEITTSLLLAFLTSTLHAGPAALGAIEGVSDALVGLSKLAGGPLSSDPVRRGRIASGGYLDRFRRCLSPIAVWQVALLRALAWISRGLRSPARDTLLYHSSREPLTAGPVRCRAGRRQRRGADRAAAGLARSAFSVSHAILLAISVLWSRSSAPE